ncbi:HU family DNA-binding protein [bacterium CPR1]|nr:HU family DNA-binding protein [bacterium CPR1]
MGRTQKEFADALAGELGLSIRTSRAYLARFLQLVADDLVETGRVELRGMGIFQVHALPPREIVHPGTGQAVTIPARKVVRFRTPIALRRRLNPPTTKKRRGS